MAETIKTRYLHIPKSGGTTFAEILARQYYGKGQFTFNGDIYDDIERFCALSQKERSNIELFCGHAPIETCIPEANSCNIITILREPVSRIISFCHHVFEGKSSYLQSDFPPGLFSLDDFLRSGNEELSNLLTKMLINSGCCESSYLLYSMTPPQARDLAVKNLINRICCFGILENFEESLRLFATRLKWRLPSLLFKIRNVKDNRQQIQFTYEHIELIKKMNAIDIEVYKIAMAKFKQIIYSEKLIPAKIIKFKKYNLLLQLNYKFF
jgi:hypothetical protein